MGLFGSGRAQRLPELLFPNNNAVVRAVRRDVTAYGRDKRAPVWYVKVTQVL